MKPVTSRFSGKVLLSGEHSVVYGQPALVASVDRNMTVTLRPSNGFHLQSAVEDKIGLVRYALELAEVDPDVYSVSIDSNIPSGLGTSAAVCAGVIQAAYESVGNKLERDALFRLAWQCEKRAHGNSSGVDPAAVVYGGLIWYVRDKERTTLPLKTHYSFLLVDSGTPKESTGEMVSLVGSRLKHKKATFKKHITEIGEVTRLFRRQLLKGQRVTKVINDNGLLLEKLGIVSKQTRELSEHLRAMGCGVKVTGAGGVKTGSGMLLVDHPEFDTISRKLTSMRLNLFEIIIGDDL